MDRSRISILLALAALAATLALVVPAGAAGAVTIGQLAPDGTPSQCNVAPVDRAQPTVTSGNAYVVPSQPPASASVITSWSYNAGAGEGQTMTMKVFRKVAEPATFQAVGNDGPRPIAGGTLNTFSTNVPVSPGDILGTNQPTSVGTACFFSAPGDSSRYREGNLADGAPGESFSAFPDWRLNVSAVVEPDADGDGFGDETQDQCPTNPSTQGPCPPDGGAVPPLVDYTRALSLSYSEKKDKFKGRLASQSPACISGQKVKLFEKQKGKDPKLGSSETNETGKYALKEKKADGKFYATVKKRITSAGTCLAAESKTIKVGG